MANLMLNTKAMFWRSWLKTLRAPEALMVSIFVPGLLMVIFVKVFGGSMDVGMDNFANFIVPAILVNALLQGSASVAISVNQDMTKGVVQRFRAINISHVSFLMGHVLSAFIKTLFTSAVVILVAMLVGFRPSANFTAWLTVLGLIVLFVFAVIWIAVFLGVAMADSESAGGLMSLTAVFVFLSNGFAPTKNMPTWLRVFADNQPVTPFINSLRALMNGYSLPASDLWLTLIWWGGILIAMMWATVAIYKKKLSI